MGSAPARRRPPIHYDYPSCLCTRFVDQLYFGLLRDRHGRSLDRFLKKGGRDCLADAGASVSFYEEVKRFAV